MSDSLDATVWKQNRNVIATAIDGGHVLFNIDGSNYVSLNRTAGLIWEALTKAATADELSQLLVDRFDVAPETARAATDRTLALLLEQKLVDRDPC